MADKIVQLTPNEGKLVTEQPAADPTEEGKLVTESEAAEIKADPPADQEQDQDFITPRSNLESPAKVGESSSESEVEISPHKEEEKEEEKEVYTPTRPIFPDLLRPKREEDDIELWSTTSTCSTDTIQHQRLFNETSSVVDTVENGAIMADIGAATEDLTPEGAVVDDLTPEGQVTEGGPMAVDITPESAPHITLLGTPITPMYDEHDRMDMGPDQTVDDPEDATEPTEPEESYKPFESFEIVEPAESEIVTEVTPVEEAAPVEEVAPIGESEAAPVVHAEPTPEPTPVETKTAAEPVIEAEPVVAEPATEPVTVTEPVTEPVAAAEPVTAPEPVSEPQSVSEAPASDPEDEIIAKQSEVVTKEPSEPVTEEASTKEATKEETPSDGWVQILGNDSIKRRVC